MLASQVQVRINGRLIQPIDMRVTSLESSSSLQERAWFAAYMYRVFGAWPGEDCTPEDNPSPALPASREGVGFGDNARGE